MLTKPLSRPAARYSAALISLFISMAVAANTATYQVEATSTTDFLTLDAKVEAVNAGTISAQTSGTIESLNFDVNDAVKAGQVLLTIRDTQQKAALAQANAMHEDAQLLLKRNRALLKKGTLSQGEFDRTQAQAKSAQAALVQAQEQLSYTVVKAPYSGVVSARHVELGETVNPGQPLMSGFSLQPLRAVTDIPASIAQQLSDDSYQTSYLSSAGKQHQLTAMTLFPYADSRFNSVRARFDIKPDLQAPLLPGSWVQLKLAKGESEKLQIPASALLQRGELSAVYVQQEQTFVLRYVRAGKRSGQHIQIISGLRAGDVIAVNALQALKAQENAQ